MHRKKVKLKKFGRHVKTPLSAHSHVNHTTVNASVPEMSPELKRVYQLGMKNLIAQCRLCGKKFINKPYLHAHHERRHYGQLYHPQIIDGSSALLEVEIKYLKHRLSALECQLLKREWQRSFKGNVKVTEDSETENKISEAEKDCEPSILETKVVEIDKKSDSSKQKINKYEKEVEELKSMFFSQIKELKQMSQQPMTVCVSSEFVQTEDAVDIIEKKSERVSYQLSQPLSVTSESVQTDVITVDVPEKDDGELQDKLEEQESVWEQRLAKMDEQHKQELKQIHDRLQQTSEEGNRIKQELEEKLKEALLKLAAIGEENAWLLENQSCLEEEVVTSRRNSITLFDRKDAGSDEQNEKTSIKSKTLIVKSNSVEDTNLNNKLVEADIESSCENRTEIVAFEKDKEDESDFEINLPDGFTHKQDTYNKNNVSRPIVGNFCKDYFENLKDNEKNTEEQMPPVKQNRSNKNRPHNIMDFLNESEESLIKIPVKKLNFTSTESGNNIREVNSNKEHSTDDEVTDEEEDENEEEDEHKEEKAMIEDTSESSSSYSGSSESEDISVVDDKPSKRVIEFKQPQPVQRPVQKKLASVSGVDLKELISEVYLQTLENMQQHLIVQPDMVNGVRQDVEEKLRHRLKQLGVDPDWTGLPQVTFQSKMALKHHQNISAKSKVGYFTQRGQLAKDVDMMKRNPKGIGSYRVMQENILSKLKTKVAQILKAYPKLANHANRIQKPPVETKLPEVVKYPLHNMQQNATKTVASSSKQAPVMVQDELLRKELEEMKILQQSANKLKMYALDEDLSDSDSLSWSLSSVSKDMSPGKGTLFHVENKMKSAMKNATAASSGSISKKRVLFAEDSHVHP